MSRHTLSKTDLLQYALLGARVQRIQGDALLDKGELESLDRDIAEIGRRIKLAAIAAERKEKS